ncbi:MAG: PAS domain-containing sensor histidine kinase [Bacteroidetes bacterium]|nr:PAS domain-containing sensor histidine kinase [Bacteroidota bacterium]
MPHRILQRQLRKYGLSQHEVPSDEASWRRFLDAVGSAYEDADQGRYLLERSLEISSREMRELHNSLKDRLGVEIEKLRGIVGSIGAGLCILDRDGVIVDSNREACRLLGVAEEELKGTEMFSLLRCATDGGNAAARHAMQAGSGYYNINSELRSAGGQFVPITFSINPINEGHMIGMSVLVFFDTTAYQESERSARETLSLLNSTLQSTADGILVVDADGKILQFNDRFASMWSIPQEILDARDDAMAIGHVLSQLEDPQAFIDEVNRLYSSTEESFDRLHFKDGRVLERFSRPLVGESGVAGRVWSFRDVSKQVHAESALEEHARELEDLVLELKEARDRAEESAQFKSVVLNNMSHEIRTPMAAIIGFAQILAEELNETHAEFVEYITTNGKRLLDTINSVLDFSRLELNEATMKLAECDLATVTAAHAALLKPIATKKGIELDVEARANPRVLVDDAAFARIAYNIIGNAIKFTDEGSVSVVIDDSPNGPCVVISDTGIGISEEFLPTLFSEFKQESSGLSREYEGSGLGLAITRKLVLALGGRISVESQKNVGTTFTIQFPPAGEYANASDLLARSEAA